MSAVHAQVLCTRFREQISLELDDVLSQLELRMLDTHLAACAACAAYAADVRDVTAQIRRAPLEPIRRPVLIRSQRTLTGMRLQAGIAAACALAALGLGTQVALEPSTSASSSLGSVTRFPTATETQNEMTLLRLARYGDVRSRTAAEI